MFVCAPFNALIPKYRRKAWLFTCLLALAVGANSVPVASAADNFRTLNGPEIQKLFSEEFSAWFPSDGTGTDSDDWSISFQANGNWEASASGADAFGVWKVEGDKQCVTIENSSVASPDDENFIFEGCFSVFVDQANATVAASFPKLGKKQFILKEGAYDALARLGAGPSNAQAEARQEAPKAAVETDQAAADAERKALEREKREQEAQARQAAAEKEREALERQKREQEAQARQAAAEKEREALERQKREQEARARQAAAAKEREAKRASEADSQRRQLEQQRLAAEARIKQLQMELELERLRQQRSATPQTQPGGDRNPPVIQAAAKLETRAARITIQGVAKDDVSLVRVELNGRRIETRNGRFSTEEPVALGRNRMRITAFDAQGNKTEHVVSVTRKRDVPDIAYGNYYALVIGINDYKSLPKLKTAIADAETVAQTLEDLYGYKVTRLTNPSRADIIDALDEYRDLLAEEDNLLIYYAGHGWLDQQTGAGYWMPVNAKADRRSRWISNGTLTNALQALLAKHVMVVADSCYSGTLTRSLKVPQRNRAYLERMAEKRARVVLASGGLEPVADSGGGKHSVFAAQFLKALRSNEGVLDGTKLFETVRQNVVLNAEQTPEYSDIRQAGHEGGDFLFVRKE